MFGYFTFCSVKQLIKPLLIIGYFRVMQKLGFLLLIIFTFTQANAQLIKEYKSIANRAFANGDYYKAMENYRHAFRKDSFNLNLAYKYAESCRMYQDYFQAQELYKHIILNDFGGQYTEALFWMGDLKKREESYDDALAFYEAYIDKVQEFGKKGDFEEWARNEVKYQMQIFKILEDTLSIQVEHLGTDINSSFADLAPFPVNDSTIYFTSLRKDAIDEDQNEKLATRPFKMYKGFKKDGEWIIDRQWKIKVNKGSHQHRGNLVVDSIQQRYYYTKCEALNASGISCQLYMMDFGDTSKKVIEPIKEINMDGYSSTQPTLINGDKQYLVFSSDRPGTMGELDLWRAEVLKDGSFGPVVNLGEKVNSIGNEITPYMNNASGMLYFSSDYWIGLGGYDVFETKVEKDTIIESIKNVGFPVNTSYNDIYYSITPDSLGGFIASNRTGGIFINGEHCCHDIYHYQFVEEYVPMVIQEEFSSEQNTSTASIDLPELEYELTKEDLDTRAILERNELSYNDIRIYFGFDASKLDKESKRQLDKLQK